MAAESPIQPRSIDAYGFWQDSQGPSAPPTTSPNTKELESKWISVLDRWPQALKQKRKLKKLVRSGIPQSLRGRVWMTLANVDQYRREGEFERLQQQEPTPIFEVIDRDIHRCYPNHSMFSEANGDGQVSLRNILQAYAIYNPEVGYCQGMGFLVGMMLMHLQAEDAFWLLVASLDRYSQGYYTPTMSKLLSDANVFQSLLKTHSRRLWKHMNNQEVTPLMYMTQWFLTLYTTVLPWPTVLRIWDMFYMQGVKVLFRTGLAIMRILEPSLLKSPTTADLVTLLLHLPPERFGPDTIVEQSLKISIKSKSLEAMRKASSKSALSEARSSQPSPS
ncbi:rab-GTPase-TBC domain-containing protein [Polychytrium aggregatum]|uniref:rab-GTPase-TBC domain-containing protein n=1 Tax=Polychytrium aggregatum TaxID=110093 RepID=UPI0022FEDBF1|nr:rab-GTPase-TBC domain-containing protein [Polychytrium aggregatum]KAI9197289.1 rab-GTPase-TBC domain-containing protein [Polychytrium aggregatum]